MPTLTQNDSLQRADCTRAINLLRNPRIYAKALLPRIYKLRNRNMTLSKQNGLFKVRVGAKVYFVYSIARAFVILGRGF